MLGICATRKVTDYKMNFYVGITDKNWFEHHKSTQADEVNYWLPGGNTGFKAISEGDLFLFKLHKRNSGKIVGGGFFVRETPKY